jgi:hypothetical protein
LRRVVLFDQVTLNHMNVIAVWRAPYVSAETYSEMTYVIIPL